MAARVVQEVKDTLEQFGPAVLRTKYDEQFSKNPGPTKRLQAAAGPHKSGNDPHIAGRALDIVLYATIEAERVVADKLVEVFLTLREDMRWGGLIYNGSEWNSRGNKFPRTGTEINRHVTHIHIEWGAKTIDTVNPDNFKQRFISELMKIS